MTDDQWLQLGGGSSGGRAPPGGVRVKFSDRSPLTAGVRFRLTGPVSSVTGRNRTNTNLNSNSPVETVLTGIPAGLTGLPAGLTGLPAGLTGNRSVDW